MEKIEIEDFELEPVMIGRVESTGDEVALTQGGKSSGSSDCPPYYSSVDTY